MQEAKVFIVHLWAGQAPAAFRATVLRPGSDESAWFTQADALVRYFVHQASAPAVACQFNRGRREQP